MMKRLFTLLAPMFLLALLPTLVSGDTPSLAAMASSNPLAFVEAVYDAGLEGASSIALSPDEQFVYIASSIDDTVTVFRREDTSGRLAFVEVKRDGAGGANELEGATGVAVSPDGGHVYVTSAGDNALTVFSRDAATGKLTFVEEHKDGVGGIVSLEGAKGVAVSSDNKHIYVASWRDGTVSAFSRNPSTGALTFVEAEGATSGLDMTYSLAISPDGKHVYATNYDYATVTVFERNATTGDLTYHSTVQDGVGGIDGLDGAIHITVSADGANVYVTGVAEDAVAVFRRNATTGALIFVEAEFDETAGVDGLDGARAVAVSHDGAHVYVAGNGDHAVAIFSRQPTDGALSYAGMVENGSAGVNEMQSPYGITLAQDDDHLYVAARSYGAVEVFDRNASDGSLTIVEEQQSGDGLEGAVGVAVSSSGCVYAAGYDDDAVAFFSRNASTGALAYENNLSADYVDGLNGAVGVAVSPNEKHVYVAGRDDDAVVAFERQFGCSWLDHIATYTDTVVPGGGLDGARALAVSPDGSLLYVASELDDTIVIFDRNGSTGELTFKQAVSEVGSLQDLDGAYAVAVSPDGANFYVASFYDNAVTVFLWYDGTLYYEGVVKDGVDSVDGLDGANSIAVSPDGKYVYVASRRDDAVAYFWRNPSDGLLTYRGMVQDGVGGVDGLNGARALTIGPDGSQVYVASQPDDALAIFDRSSDDGSLTFLAAYKDGVGGPDGLDTADGVAVSPDGAHVYVGGYGDDALAVFARWRVYLPLVLRN
jgi:6-phosphogluconolactonase (cycloisomerase 2 family)